MVMETTRWDSAAHLQNDEDIKFYLEACSEMAADDPAFLLHALGVIARAKNISLAEIGLKEGDNLTFMTVAKIASALGLQITLQLPLKNNFLPK